ncbi:hypothetical protein [Curtobacterium sp. Leaf261]|uniref:hypothetical protein n=1 Tax=Curtobacterium sp. Leaf261 TaxID=1736311 RepID=UPI0006F6815E|nr:hypothetical protein [Curtobacterium sp. Leaf261]KQO64928.1 hypothetical protein ASF23_01820 [Curtobacterium sp. Leaf261]
MSDSEVLFIGGRSGVGKTSAAAALHVLLTSLDVRHAVIEGDTLDLAHPAPWAEGHALAEQNLAAIWANYRALGYRRLVYTNTVSVLEARHLSAAMGDDPRVVAVLLHADDTTTAARLAGREHGPELERSIAKSAAAARHLESAADGDVDRLDTAGRTPEQVAEALLARAGWTERP